MVSSPEEETLDTTFTVTRLLPATASSTTSVMIPFRYPLKVDTAPAPARVMFESAAVTPYPTTAPAVAASPESISKI